MMPAEAILLGDIDLEQLRGFVYVGAGALALLAIAVIAMGLFANRSGRAEGLAVLGLFRLCGLSRCGDRCALRHEPQELKAA